MFRNVCQTSGLIFCAILLLIPFIIFARNESEIYEIISHKLRIKIIPQEKLIFCEDTISIKVNYLRTNDIRLKLLSVYKVSSIVIKGKPAKYKHEKENLIITTIPKDTVFDLIVSYDGRLSFRSDFSFILPDRLYLRDEEIIPHGPRSLSYAKLYIEVPEEWETIALGELIDKKTQDDSTVYVWEVNQPIPTLGWICAGRFSIEKTKDDDVVFSLYTFPDDTLSAEPIFSLARDAISFFGKRFIKYRFSKLAIVEIDDWFAGKNVIAVAFPSVILVKRAAFFSEDRFNHISAILPHEIAHQWWPLTVFIEDKDAAFLSEGMCEYSALLFNQSRGSMTKRDSLSDHPLLRSLVMRAMRGNDLPLQQKADLRFLPTHYLKGSYTHHMLRTLLGDSVFLVLYKSFAEQFKLRVATLSDFQKLAEGFSGKQLNWFFDQWIKNKGIPKLKVYNIKCSQVEKKWRTSGRVRIIGYEKFTIPVEIGLETNLGVLTKSLWLGIDNLGIYRNEVGFEIFSDSKPHRVIVDPKGNLLKIQNMPVKLSDLREPADGLMIYGSQNNGGYLLALARADSIEMERGGWSITIKDDKAITLRDLQNERVFLYGKTSENRIVADIQNRFPIIFSGDSVVISGEKMFDSTISLIQIIENPFLTNGLICWIVPLSEKAKPKLMPYNASWILVRSNEEIFSGTWQVKDENLVFEIK